MWKPSYSLLLLVAALPAYAAENPNNPYAKGTIEYACHDGNIAACTSWRERECHAGNRAACDYYVAREKKTRTNGAESSTRMMLAHSAFASVVRRTDKWGRHHLPRPHGAPDRDRRTQARWADGVPRSHGAVDRVVGPLTTPPPAPATTAHRRALVRWPGWLVFRCRRAVRWAHHEPALAV